MLAPTLYVSLADDQGSDMAQKHLRKVKQAAADIDKARRGFELAVVDAYESGETLRDIAQWAGTGHQRIHQIIRDARQSP